MCPPCQNIGVEHITHYDHDYGKVGYPQIPNRLSAETLVAWYLTQENTPTLTLGAAKTTRAW